MNLQNESEDGRALANEMPEWVEGNFRLFLDAVPDAMLVVNGQGEIVIANAQVETLFRCARHQLLGKNVEILIPERFRGKHPGHTRHYFADPRMRPMGAGLELHALRFDGTEFSVEISLSPLRTGAGTFIISVVRDISERKRFAETLQQKNVELENALAVKDRFLASMSHELRTPLNSIIGFSGTMLMGLPGPLTDEQARQLLMVQASGKHLLLLINDLLDLANIESGKVELSPEEFDGCGLLCDIAATLKPLANNKGLTLEIKTPASPLLVFGDRRAINQVLLNLVNNAIKYTEKGSVSLELKQHRNNGTTITEFAVADTGIGISPDDQARLFQAFQPVGSKRSGGPGLGLHLSRKLAHMLGGEIQLESRIGEGSRFTLMLKPEGAAGAKTS
jgi:protein-histidine pros-kinase